MMLTFWLCVRPDPSLSRELKKKKKKKRRRVDRYLCCVIMDVVDQDQFRQPWSSGSPPSKRTRSGTIGQRLRTASDLELGGWISQTQKDAMKEKIMRGNEELLHAMDQYAVGNGAVLQHLISTGALDTNPSSIFEAVDALEMEVSEGLTCVARTCRICHQQFTMNHDKACQFHPESFAGETAQRWMVTPLHQPYNSTNRPRCASYLYRRALNPYYRLLARPTAAASCTTFIRAAGPPTSTHRGAARGGTTRTTTTTNPAWNSGGPAWGCEQALADHYMFEQVLL